MSKVFVSYRRDDSAGFAGRLTDALERRFGVDSVFRDVDDIAAGADFGVVIEQALQQVQAVLVVIGPRWLDARDMRGRRLDDPGDYVRREIALALASGKPVIPVLVGGATMPVAEALPPTLRGLANRNALSLGDAGWGAVGSGARRPRWWRCSSRSAAAGGGGCGVSSGDRRRSSGSGAPRSPIRGT